MKSEIQTGLLDVMKSSEGHFLVCQSSLFKIRHRMCIRSERSTGDQIKSTRHIILAGESGKAIQE